MTDIGNRFRAWVQELPNHRAECAISHGDIEEGDSANCARESSTQSHVPVVGRLLDPQSKLLELSSSDRAVAQDVADAFGDIGPVEVVEVLQYGLQADGKYIARNPRRQPVIDLLLPILDADPEYGEALAGDWKERIAICEADGMSAEDAEAVALADLRNTLKRTQEKEHNND